MTRSETRQILRVFDMPLEHAIAKPQDDTAQAALCAGKPATAHAYVQKLAALVAALARQGKDPDALRRHYDTLEKLKRQLPEAP